MCKAAANVALAVQNVLVIVMFYYAEGFPEVSR